MERRLSLVLVEGIPFTGKSTISEYICQQLNLNGYPALWVPEGMMLKRYFPDVLASFAEAKPLTQETLWQNWSAFVETVRQAPATFVVDSALSYAAIYRLMQSNTATPEIIVWLDRLAELIAPLQPRVIHLTGNAEYLAKASIVERGAGWEKQLVSQSEATLYQQARGRKGVEGAIRMLEETQALAHRILAAGWEPLTLDVTGGEWATYQQMILDFLDIPKVEVTPPAITQEMLQAYSGAYTLDQDDGSQRTLIVQLEQETLALYGSDTRYGLLIPLTESRFHLQASDLDIEFEAAGQKYRLVLLSSDGERRAVYNRFDGQAACRKSIQ
jgi:hypothetical protein